MADFKDLLPWVTNLLEFFMMAALLWRAFSALDKALARFSPQPNPLGAVPVPAQPAASKPVPAPPQPAVVVDQGLVNAVKKFEGFSAKAYGDYKQYSIGYGTRAASPTEVITEAEAEKRLAAEIAIADQSVEHFAPNAPVGVKQGLTDLTYNVGPIWQQQSLGELIKAGKYEEAKSHVLQYNHAGGQVLDALTKRREAEVSWFDHPL